MAAKIPASFRDLFRRKSFGHLATVMPDGGPQVTPVWVDLEGDQLVVNSARGRVKDENVRRNPNVALSVLDPDNPYRHLTIRGRVVEITDKGADDHIDKLAQRYLGEQRYPWRKPGEARVIYRIEPQHFATMG